MTVAWRLAALTGLAAGLALAPGASRLPLHALEALGLIGLAGAGLAVVRPVAFRPSAFLWLAGLGVVSGAAGIVVGGERLIAIDDDAYAGETDAHVSVRGYVTAVPRPIEGVVTIPVSTRDGKLGIEVPEPGRELDVGQEVRAAGVVREPEPWRADRLRIAGIHRVVSAGWIEPTGRRREGVAGAIDDSRERAEAALERGVPAPEAALARGFVLGQDDRLDEATVDDFRRSGLAHLLAVSGQNVLLLALLAIPVLALLGVSLRARLIVVIALIAVYVPITGAGPSIQRAAVMGVAAIVAVLAGRPSHRWYALGLAAATTLAVNPRAAADVGWQLSFAAVVGILLWARPLAALASRAVGGRGQIPRTGLDVRQGLAEGIGVTVAATIATAPIAAHHFETISIASLPANLLALPAVAPVMWLGMLSAGLGQLEWLPVEPLNWLSSLLVAYVAQVAHWLGAPSWAAAEISAPGPAALAAILAALAVTGAVAARGAARRRGLRGAARIAVPAALAVAILPLGVAAAGGPPRVGQPSAPGLTVSVLDVGQGDAILLDPEPGGAILVDTGPPGGDVPVELADRGIESLGAAIVTHDQSDHAGGLGELLETVPAGTVGLAEAGRDLRLAARAADAPITWLARGDVLRAGPLRVEVLWPPAVDDDARAGDPNARSLVLLARWRRFEALLTGDAEAELAPLDPGRVDLLKLAHHGSEDHGLPALLERTKPRLALISVGAGNPYGHPHPATLGALAEADVPTLRTDENGDIDVEVGAGTMRVRP